MKVDQLMTTDVRSCHPNETLDAVARIMWERDCGCVPVIDDERRLLGIVTDRDACMAAWSRGRTLSGIEAGSVMSHEVKRCRSDDAVEDAEQVMRAARVRRLPVVDGDDRLVGILSLGDVAREAADERLAGRHDITEEDVARTLAAVSVQGVPAPVAHWSAG